METLAAIIFVLMYMLIVSEKVHRTIVAMMGAIIMIIAGIMPVDTALHHINFNTLGLLIGMMVLVGYGVNVFRNGQSVGGKIAELVGRIPR